MERRTGGKKGHQPSNLRRKKNWNAKNELRWRVVEGFVRDLLAPRNHKEMVSLFQHVSKAAEVKERGDKSGNGKNPEGGRDNQPPKKNMFEKKKRSYRAGTPPKRKKTSGRKKRTDRERKEIWGRHHAPK